MEFLITETDLHPDQMNDICSGPGDDGQVVRDLLEHLGDTWTPPIGGMLESGPIRCSERATR